MGANVAGVDEHRSLGMGSLVLPVSSRRGVPASRFGQVAGGLGLGMLSVFLALLVLNTSKEDQGAKQIETLATILCCQGCCRGMIPVTAFSAGAGTSSASSSSGAGALRARATVLHFAGQSEIDYTANGHRVSQHMESAVKELTSLEDHVKSGMPKYLRESAVQRERDLVNHRFAARDLGGSSKAKKLVAAKDKHSVQPTLQASSGQQGAGVTPRLNQDVMLSKSKKDKRIDDQLLEAEQMNAHLQNKDQDEMRAIVSPATKALSKGIHGAEKEAETAYKRYSKQKTVNHARHGIGISSELGKESQSLHALPQQIHNGASGAASTGSEAHASSVPRTSVEKAAPTQKRRRASDKARSAESMRLHAEKEVSTRLKAAQAVAAAGGFAPITGDGFGGIVAASTPDPLHPATEQQVHDEAVVKALAAKSYHLNFGQKTSYPTRGPNVVVQGKTIPRNHPVVEDHSAHHASTQDHHAQGTEGAKLGSSAVAALKGGKEAKRLKGVLNHITKIIGSYTGDANQHSTFLKHFDSEKQKGSPPQLKSQSAVGSKRAAVKSNVELNAARHSHGTKGAQLKSQQAGSGSVEHSELWQLSSKQALTSMQDASMDLSEVMNRKRERLSSNQIKSVVGLQMHLRR